MELKLGRKAIKKDPRTLKVSTYFTQLIPPAPPSVDWTKGVIDFGVMGNDRLGDCTICGIAHGIQVWTSNASCMVTLPDETVIDYYTKFCGYNPTDPSSDRGGIELDILKQWRNSDFSGHKLDAFTSVDFKTQEEVKTVINLFGGAYIGLSLPMTAQTQLQNGQVWDVVSRTFWDVLRGKPGTWGGHCVYVCGYDASGVTCITWGKLQKMTWAFWNKYVDEAYALIGLDWFNTCGHTPLGFDINTLRGDLQKVSA